jgi:hypothetical protein
VFQLALTALRHLHGTAADDKLKEQARAPTSGSFIFVRPDLRRTSAEI